jgi:hypothetical protein
LRRHVVIKAINGGAIGTGDQVSVRVDSNLNAAVSEHRAYVGGAFVLSIAMLGAQGLGRRGADGAKALSSSPSRDPEPRSAARSHA